MLHCGDEQPGTDAGLWKVYADVSNLKVQVVVVLPTSGMYRGRESE